jgi:RNA polymerase sigma factor (sigma-70 family)
MSSPAPAPEDAGRDAERLFVVFKAGVQAFTELLAGYQTYLISIAARDLPDGLMARAGASDIVQDAYVGVLKRLERETSGLWAVQTVENLRGWMAQFVRFTLKNHIKAQTAGKGDPSRERPAGTDGLDPPASGPSVTSMVRRSERDEHLDRAIKNLPDEIDRLLIRARYWYDVGFRELGVMLSGEASDASRMEASRRIADIRARLLRDELRGGPGDCHE